jgi:hypothetical protein
LLLKDPKRQFRAVGSKPHGLPAVTSRNFPQRPPLVLDELFDCARFRGEPGYGGLAGPGQSRIFDELLFDSHLFPLAALTACLSPSAAVSCRAKWVAIAAL